MTIIYEFEINCATHGLVSTNTGYTQGIYGTVDPTQCPYNSNDTVLGVSIIRTIEDSSFKIVEEETPTQGFMHVAGRCFDVPSGNTGDISHFTMTVEENINVYEVTIMCEQEHKDDTFSMYVTPPTPVGLITQNISIGDTTVYLSSTAMLYFKRGFTVAVQNGLNVELVGIVTAVNQNTSSVTIRNPSTVAITASGTSYVYLYITRGNDIQLCSNTNIILGNGKIGGSFATKGYIVHLYYKNNTGLAKKFKFNIENTY